MNLQKTLGSLFLLLVVNIAHADYGCHFVMDKLLSQALDGPNIKISIRFTCREDMNLIGVSFFCSTAQKSPSYLVSIREDKEGLPSPDVLTSNSITPKGNSWITLPIDNLPLQAGKVYHMVMEQDAFRGGMHKVGLIGPDHFASIAYGDFLNSFDPRNENSDPKLNLLIFQNDQWKVLNRQPLFALQGTGSKVQGVPYDEPGNLPIHGNGTPNDPTDDVIQGEALHPHYGFTGTGLAIRVRREGHPTAPLNYAVYIIDFMHHKTIPSFSGEALNPDQVSASFRWVTIGFNPKDHPQTFPPQGQCVVFQTDSGKAATGATSCSDCYIISEIGNSGGLANAADLSFDGGAHLSREVYSTDGWATWMDEFERDANVVILGPVQSRMEEPNPNPIPTPLPLLGGTNP